MIKPSASLPSDTVKVRTGCGNIFITTVFSSDTDRRPVKVLLQLGKAGGCVKAHLSVLAEHINLAIEKGHSETVLALSRLSGVTCSAGDSCIAAVVDNLLNRILNKQETEHNDNREE